MSHHNIAIIVALPELIIRTLGLQEGHGATRHTSGRLRLILATRVNLHTLVPHDRRAHNRTIREEDTLFFTTLSPTHDISVVPVGTEHHTLVTVRHEELRVPVSHIGGATLRDGLVHIPVTVQTVTEAHADDDAPAPPVHENIVHSTEVHEHIQRVVEGSISHIEADGHIGHIAVYIAMSPERQLLAATSWDASTGETA